MDGTCSLSVVKLPIYGIVVASAVVCCGLGSHQQVAIELLNTGIANRDDITSYEPYVLIGLPAVVVLKALLRTPHNAQHFTLADGTYIDQMTRAVDTSL